MDFYYLHSPKAVQIDVFERFMDLALKRSMPVVVHQRDSMEQTVACMKPFCDRGLRGISSETLSAQVLSNSQRLFGIP